MVNNAAMADNKILYDMRESNEDNAEKEENLFTIDAFPNEGEDFKKPLYVKNGLSKMTKDKKRSDKCKRTIKCFNCSGNHLLHNCPQPKDHATIIKNSNSKKTQTRYHKKDDAPPPSQQFRAGEISDNLRKALGLNHNQIPMHVYRMRVLGYPPGWLEEHKNANNDTKNNDKDDSIIHFPKMNQELITYPGFNKEPKPGTLNESLFYRVPKFYQIQPHNINMVLNQSGTTPKRRANPKKKSVWNDVTISPPRTVDMVKHRIPIHTELRTIKSSVLGTPVKSYSAYSNLPDYEFFSKQMSDIIHFENLPGSVGKYGKMKGLLEKVRSAVQDMKSK